MILPEVTLISDRKEILSFVQKITKSIVTEKTFKELTEFEYINSGMLFIDVKQIQKSDEEKFFDYVRRNDGKVILICDTSLSSQMIQKSISLSKLVISYPCNINLAKQIADKYVFDSFDEYNLLSEFREINRKLESCDELNILFGVSPYMKKLKSEILKCAKDNRHVLLLGESGTGKSTVARIIHKLSERKNKPYIMANMGSISEGLVESTLFGTVEGAYTDAKHRDGLLQSGNGGTIFMDEIGNTSVNLQSKLLTFMEDGNFYKVGSNKIENVDIRIIFATNQNLQEKIIGNEFKKELYFRMSANIIHFEPLRRHKEDIIYIAEQIASQQNKFLNESAIKKLQSYSWPGNIRQLRYCIENACRIKGNTIDARDIQIES